MMDKATLEEKVADLSRRVSRLEGAGRSYGPVETIPMGGPPWGVPYAPAPVRDVARCGVCAIKLEGVMGYVCGVPNCPTGLGGCSVTMVTGDAATLAKVYGHGGPFGEDGALLAVGYAENQ